MKTNYQAIVVGAGNAGCEAALALARTGIKTLCLTLHLDHMAYLPCNPAIGGTSKGHLVREVDALGGQMGLTTDKTLIQCRMLNTRKGPAVHSLRAQVDKQAYSSAMRYELEHEPNLDLLQAEGARVLLRNGKAAGIVSTHGEEFEADAVVITTGVYLNSCLYTGAWTSLSGPSGLQRATHLSQSLAEDCGLTLRRFKTGTPPRIDGKTMDVSKMQIQQGDTPLVPFSFLTPASKFDGFEQTPCYLTYTNEKTHEILRGSLDRSPMFGGVITGTGARYCPSIEDKVVRFADKPRHQLFIEPEGLYTTEKYVQGFSTSMPLDVQKQALATIPGLEQARIVRPGYAIEYDCIDGTALTLGLMSKQIPGLFLAGQVVGSSGYEEAAAQGLVAGLNASLYLRGEAPMHLDRADGYIGVLVDDLVTKGTPEPYRMMTARAEHRLLLRQDNADLRLTEKGYKAGLATKARYEKMLAKKEQSAKATEYLRQHNTTRETAKALCGITGESFIPGTPLSKCLTRPGVDRTVMARLDETFAAFLPEAQQQAEIEVKYEGYLARQQREIERARQWESHVLPETLDYLSMPGLRTEARQKLQAQKPENLGQASRISGVSPADIAVLSILLEKQEKQHV